MLNQEPGIIPLLSPPVGVPPARAAALSSPRRSALSTRRKLQGRVSVEELCIAQDMPQLASNVEFALTVTLTDLGAGSSTGAAV